MNRIDPDITNSIQQIRMSQLIAEQKGLFNEAVSLCKRLNNQLATDYRVKMVEKKPDDCKDDEMWSIDYIYKNTLAHKIKRGQPEWDWYRTFAEKVERAFSDYKHNKSKAGNW